LASVHGVAILLPDIKQYPGDMLHQIVPVRDPTRFPLAAQFEDLESALLTAYWTSNLTFS
jgi:hypothetical protein